MLFYFVVGIISAYFLNKYVKHKKKIYLFISFLSLFLISALRYGIGYDYFYVYVPMFNMIAQGIPVGWEIGVVYLAKFITFFSTNPQYFFALTAFVTFVFLYKGFISNSAVPWLSLFLFVITGEYIVSFNLVRQYIAVAIFVYSFKYIFSNDLKKYLIFVLVASLFHKSAIILLPVYFLTKMKKGLGKHIVIILCSIVSLTFIGKLFELIIINFSYSWYLDSAFAEFDPTFSELILSLITYIFTLMHYKNNKNDSKYLFMLNMSLFYVVMSIISFKVIMGARFIIYFRIIQLYIYPYLLSKYKHKMTKNIFTILIILLFSGVTLIGGHFFGWYDTEYISIFNKEAYYGK